MNRINQILILIILSLVVGILFLLINSTSSILFWLFFLNLGFILYKDINYRMLHQTSFLISSLLGLIITLDNFNNFNSYFGFAVDDYTYFSNGVKIAIDGFDFTKDIYSNIIGFLMSIIKTPLHYDLSLPDILPFNWFLISILVVNIKKIILEITGKSAPNIILISSILFNFIFIDTTVRLYRDIVILLLFTFFAIVVLKNKKTKALIYLLLIGLLRGANLGFSIIVVFFKKIKLENKIVTLVTLFTILISSNYIIKNTNLIAYATTFSGIRTSKLMGGLDNASSYIEFRNKDVYDESLGKSRFVNEYKLDFIAKPLEMTFSSLTIHGVNQNFEQHFADSASKSGNGTFYYELVKDLFILNWIYIFPLIVLGLYTILKTNFENQVYLVLSYISILYLLSSFSGQPRHAALLVLFHPVFATIGFTSSKRYKFLYNILIYFSITFILGWNIFRHFIFS